MDIDILGIGLAKRVFQLHGADRRGHALHGSKVLRAELLGAVLKLQPRIIAMEACSSAHNWGRQFQAMGIEVRLISPQYVAPFVKTNKNDANDAAAIVEAASRPTMHFVTVKSVEQQDMRAVHRVRELLVHQHTALINQVRGLLAERGVIMAQTPTAFKRALPSILARCDGELTSICQTLVTELLEQLPILEERIARTNQWITSFLKSSALCKKIEAIDGVGPITATAIVAAVGDAKEFKNGRHLSAWLGLVPRQYSSGGKSRLQGRVFQAVTQRSDNHLHRAQSLSARAIWRSRGVHVQLVLAG